MTDPRMTPTNDAPVTVEQCDREAAANWYGAHAPRTASYEDMCQRFARHRLAALASAPADKMIDLYCRACKRSVDFKRTDFPDVPGWVARIEHDKCNLCDNGDFSAEHWIAADGREPDPDTMTASAPAGDGEPVAVIRRHADEARQAAETDVDRPQRAEQHRIFAHALDELAREVAALARPRAAVGEQEECKECGGSSLFWFVHYHNRSQVVEGRLRTGDVECLFGLGCEECSATQRIVTANDVAAILALQSPRAKVEG